MNSEVKYKYASTARLTSHRMTDHYNNLIKEKYMLYRLSISMSQYKETYSNHTQILKRKHFSRKIKLLLK